MGCWTTGGYVAPGDIPLIRSLVTSSTHRRAPQEHSSDELMVISLYNIYMVDGSWTSTTEFSGFGCGWKDSIGKIQLMGTRNLRRRETVLHSEVEAVQWAMDSMLQHSSCQLFGTNCKDMIAMINEPRAWPNFAT
ncbi:hypothetical protein F2Q69_00048413 [Brassica cretica]|uniref:RNase H type-1 domain-containing protein n=1 Tax=Brassica cretica TaxID=69181 RepID=A0A8S9PKL9_BRACR|nr:hypothetical protein F2Q69_00048413 [Brassica cretica]